MTSSEFARWLVVLIAVLPVGGGLGAMPQLSAGPSMASSDPWATVRGCTRILERVVACRTSPSLKRALDGWCRGDAVPTLTEKQLRERLSAWRKADGRRISCAIWAGRPGAADHIGERSPLARLAAGPVACDQLARALEGETWLRAAVAEQR